MGWRGMKLSSQFTMAGLTARVMTVSMVEGKFTREVREGLKPGCEEDRLGAQEPARRPLHEWFAEGGDRHRGVRIGARNAQRGGRERTAGQDGRSRGRGVCGLYESRFTRMRGCGVQRWQNQLHQRLRPCEHRGRSSDHSADGFRHWLDIKAIYGGEHSVT